jgi:hypothetical protein
VIGQILTNDEAKATGIACISLYLFDAYKPGKKQKNHYFFGKIDAKGLTHL